MNTIRPGLDGMMKNEKIHLGIVLLFFAAIYSSISLVKHYNFRTYAWDLGIINNSIYDYAHFRWNDCMLMQPQFTNLLSDHFTLIPVLLSPLYWVFGSYAMLIVQIISILFGGLGIYSFIKTRSNGHYFSLCAMIHFFLLWGIYSALAFDYHDNIVGASFVPWIFYFFERGDKKKTILFFILLLITKENMALWGVFIGLGLALFYFKEINKIKFAVALSVFAGLYFIIVLKIAMPVFSNEGRGYLHFQYEALGGNFWEAFKTIISRPKYIFTLLFENHLKDPIANGIKSELHYMILVSGGFALLYRPAFLVMLIPIYAQKLFNDDFCKWGLNYQYSIEFAPIISIALFVFISQLDITKGKFMLALCMIFLTGWATKNSLDGRTSVWYAPERHQFYSKAHYTRTFNVDQVYQALKLIPEDAHISAQSPLVPHLSFRNTIYQFPVVEDADYIVLLNAEETYPLSREEMNKAIEDLSSSPQWLCIYKENCTWIFKKK